MPSIIPFNAKNRLLSHAKKYLSDPALLFDERDRAIQILLKAIKYADVDLRREILLLLGSFAKEEVYWTLYEIMTDQEEPDELRDQAAIHLSVIGPFLDDPQRLVRRLINDIKSTDRDLKVRAMIALGWEGNMAAVLPLIECLYEPDDEIQEVAVNALCNLKDGRLIGLLSDRITHCSLDQKRAILFNLWRFKDRQEEVARVYRRELESGDPALRLDILMVLGQLEDQPDNEAIYRSFLRDKNPKVRALALERLGEMNVLDQAEILSLLDDHAMEVKRAAMDILQDMKKNRGTES